jgi:hypothetical protein
MPKRRSNRRYRDNIETTVKGKHKSYDDYEKYSLSVKEQIKELEDKTDKWLKNYREIYNNEQV